MRFVDLFCGVGGFSFGASQAGGTFVAGADICPKILKYHARNHHGLHFCTDLRKEDFKNFPDFELLLASPPCTGHSIGRGREREYHKVARDAAWSVPRILAKKRPLAFVVENVAEMVKWEFFSHWKHACELAGYKLQFHTLDAALYGVPQNRIRLFIIGFQDHLKINRFDFIRHQQNPIPAKTVIGWDQGIWSDVEKPGRAVKTLKKIQNAKRKFGNRFLTPFYGKGSGRRGRSLNRPLGTITTRDRWLVVDGDRCRMLTIDEYRKFMGFPEGVVIPKTRELSIKMLGNAVCPPVAEMLVKKIISAIE